MSLLLLSYRFMFTVNSYGYMIMLGRSVNTVSGQALAALAVNQN